MNPVQIEVLLSRLVSGKRNPRQVKPSREGHQRLVALIRSQGLLQPLVVRPMENKPKHFSVIAGNRRLAALKEIHRNDGDPKIPCMVRDVDVATADAFALGENFGREPMHPLDEAESFAKLAGDEGKGAEAIACEFGVTERYVRQRMKLATLAETIKVAHRQGQIDTAMAEAFAAVPENRQMEIWKEVGGNPRHAEHIRNMINNEWIDAQHALFELSIVPDSAVSRDLFGDRVLVERQTFMAAQAEALAGQRQALNEEGWAEIVIGRREDVQDRLYAMDTPERQFDQKTSKKLVTIAARRDKLEAAAEKLGDDEEAQLQRVQRRYEALEAQEREIVDQSPEYFSEETKAVASAFLILCPDGRVVREYRIPRQSRRNGTVNGTGHAGGEGAATQPKPPTSDDLGDTQLAATFAHQAIGVREALLKNAAARKRVLLLILHEKVRSEALAIRHDANGTTLLASKGETFTSVSFDRLKEKRAKLDPFADASFVNDREMYLQLGELSDAKVDALIDLLVVGCITAQMQKRTDLVQHLADELKVNIRTVWRPDTAWLSSFQKIQLGHLITELMGPPHTPAPERKKSELVEVLTKLYADAADGKLQDKKLAEQVNEWLPSNLRTPAATQAD